MLYKIKILTPMLRHHKWKMAITMTISDSYYKKPNSKTHITIRHACTHTWPLTSDSKHTFWALCLNGQKLVRRHKACGDYTKQHNAVWCSRWSRSTWIVASQVRVDQKSTMSKSSAALPQTTWSVLLSLFDGLMHCMMPIITERLLDPELTSEGRVFVCVLI